jgi:hypothetical protein
MQLACVPAPNGVAMDTLWLWCALSLGLFADDDQFRCPLICDGVQIGI